LSTTAFVLTLLVLCYAVVSGLVKRWYIAPALIFVLFGMALGPFGLGVIDVGTEAGNFTLPAQLALTVILFNQASTLDLWAVVRRRDVTFRLLVIGIPLSLILGTVTAVLLIPVMPLWEAICLAAIVAPSEVALIDALLDDRRIPERIRHALSTESGFYDGFALTALLAALAVASERAEPHPGFRCVGLVPVPHRSDVAVRGSGLRRDRGRGDRVVTSARMDERHLGPTVHARGGAGVLPGR
jgi:sodium/hydrogen antiporter